MKPREAGTDPNPQPHPFLVPSWTSPAIPTCDTQPSNSMRMEGPATPVRAGAIPLSLALGKMGCLGGFNDNHWVDLCVSAHSRVSDRLQNSSWRFLWINVPPLPSSLLLVSPPSLVSSSLPNYSGWLPNKWQHTYVRSIGLKVMHISHPLCASVWSHPTPAGSGTAGIH